MKGLRKVACVTALAGAGAIVWGVLIERHLRVLRHLNLAVLPTGHKQIRVLHLSDLHLAPWQKQKMEWVKKLAKTAPDLIVLTGDSLGHKDALPRVQETLKPFAGTPGVFVHGSNDYYAPVLKNPLKYLQEPSRLGTKTPDLDTHGLNLFLEETLVFLNLNNSAASLQIADTEITFLGLNDPHVSFDDEQLMEDKLVTLENCYEEGLRIGLVHAPYLEALDTLLHHGSDIIFSGHTHGGQVRVPGIGALTSNSDLPPSQARGLSAHTPNKSVTNRAAFLHVSAGIGTSIFAPVRFACRPEATLITLT